MNEHATGRGRRVDRFGGGPERHAHGFELFEEPDEDLEGAGEAVDPVDEERVVETETGVAERFGQSGSFAVGAGELVGVGLDVLPAGLAGHEGGEAVLLG